MPSNISDTSLTTQSTEKCSQGSEKTDAFPLLKPAIPHDIPDYETPSQKLPSRPPNDIQNIDKVHGFTGFMHVISVFLTGLAGVF